MDKRLEILSQVKVGNKLKIQKYPRNLIRVQQNFTQLRISKIEFNLRKRIEKS